MAVARATPARCAPGPRQLGGGCARRAPGGAPPRRTRAVMCAAGAPHASGGGGAAAAAVAVTTLPHPPHTQQLVGPADPHAAPHHPQAAHPPRGASGRALHRPARLAASGRASCAVRDAGGDVSLETYMRLPVEQYYILDPRQIRFLEANRFQLAVPRINLLGAALEPRIEVEVATRPDAVVLTSTRCCLRGSGPLASLDDKFAMAFRTVITWKGAGAAGGGGGGGAVEAEEPAAAPAAPALALAAAGAGDAAVPTGDGGAWGSLRSGLQLLRAGGGSGGGAAALEVDMGEMTGSASIEVFCEVVPPFHLMPREALEASCNAVLGGLVRSLLPVFMRQLAADYKRWAVDAGYRAERAERSKPLA